MEYSKFEVINEINTKNTEKAKIKTLYIYKDVFDLNTKTTEELCKETNIDFEKYNAYGSSKADAYRYSWYGFYVYVKLLVFSLIFGGINIISEFIKMNSEELGVFYSETQKSSLVLSIILFIIVLFTFIKMSRRKGFVANTFLLIIELFIFPLSLTNYTQHSDQYTLEKSFDFATYFLSLFIFGLFFTLPNLIYFSKRHIYGTDEFGEPKYIHPIFRIKYSIHQLKYLKFGLTILNDCQKICDDEDKLKNYLLDLYDKKTISQKDIQTLLQKYSVINTPPIEEKELKTQKAENETTTAEQITDEIQTDDVENTSIKKCKKCGAELNSTAKFCDNCGKKIKVDKPKRKIKKTFVVLFCILIVLVIGLTVSIVFNIVQYNDIYKTQVKLENKTSLLNYYKERYFIYFSLASDLQDEVYDLQNKADFVDDSVVIVGEDDYYYHKYGCPYLDMSSYYVFNIEYAKSEEYKKCPYCFN